MSNDALDRIAWRPLGRKQKLEYARKRAAEEERKELSDARIVKKESDQFRKIIQEQLKAAGLR